MLQQLPDPIIQKLEHELPRFLAARRWFRAKAKTISSARVQDILHAENFLILLVNVQYSQGGENLYLVPITSVVKPNAEEAADQPIATFENPNGQPVHFYDGIESPFFRITLFHALNSGATFQGRNGSLVAESNTPPAALPESLESFVSKAEQSNTSIIYNREFILKLFRQIEPGINPDIEMGAFLTASGFKNTPAVTASLEYRTHNGQAYSAAILQEFVPNQGDAWKYTLDSLSTFYARALNSTLDNPQLIGKYAASATLLGIRTAQMHVALSGSQSNSDFTPEPFTAADAQQLSDSIAAQARVSLDLLRAKHAALPLTEQQLAAQVIDFEPRILENFTTLPAADAKRIRHHGDYHLGQVLYTGADFMIIDFEGEPARPLSERRAKALALRDVAGMLRSFQYAAFAGLYGILPGLPTDPESVEKIEVCSAWWNEHVSELYLNAYFTEAGDRPFIPATPGQQTLFLKAFLLQKALYEVQYELNNRPAWVGIPLRGILNLLES